MEVACPLSRRLWGGTRDKPKNVCVGGYTEHYSMVSISCHNDAFSRILELEVISVSSQLQQKDQK